MVNACKVSYRTVCRINSQLTEAVKAFGDENGDSNRLETSTDDIEEEKVSTAKKRQTMSQTLRKN